MFNTKSKAFREWHAKRGLGDVVAAVAQPIAGVIDKVTGTRIQHCEGCRKRRDYLNEKFPFKPTSQTPQPPTPKKL